MIKKYSLALFIFILFSLSLFAGPGYHQTRSLESLWNLGHIMLFALLIYFLLEFWPWLQRQKQGRQILLVFLITLMLGVGIELTQAALGSGNPDLKDVVRDLLGGVLPPVFSARIRFRSGLRFGLKTILLLLIIVALLPTGLAALDEYRAQTRFPLLGDFESRLELTRWIGDADFRLSTTKVWHGRKSLKIRLTTERYSGVSLVYLPSDWSAYSTLHFHIYNPDSLPLTLTARIHDARHVKNGQPYSDRFNKRFTVHAGWNEIIMDLNEVKSAPRTRTMDMKKIKNFAVFATRLPASRVIYLDDVFLSKEPPSGAGG